MRLALARTLFARYSGCSSHSVVGIRRVVSLEFAKPSKKP